MASTLTRSMVLRTCPVVGLLAGSFFLMSPTLAQSVTSVPILLDLNPLAIQERVGLAASPVGAGVGASMSTGQAEQRGLVLVVAEVEQEREVAQSHQSSPQMGEPLEQVAVADPYEQRLAGMRLSTILSKRPVLASDPFDAHASARIDIQQNEVPKHWLIDPVDVTLRQTLLRWSDSIGWQLIWEADKDFAIDARVELHATFKSALETVMLSLADSAYPLQASLNRDARIVRVQRYMEQRAR